MMRCATHKVCAAALERWRGVVMSAPGAAAHVVPLVRAQLHHGALFFVHEYVPCARTLLEQHWYGPRRRHVMMMLLV